MELNVWLPLKDIPSIVLSGNQISLLPNKEFEQAWKEGDMTYILVASEKPREVTEVPKEVESLLARFEGLALQELLAGLPHLWNV